MPVWNVTINGETVGLVDASMYLSSILLKIQLESINYEWTRIQRGVLNPKAGVVTVPTLAEDLNAKSETITKNNSVVYRFHSTHPAAPYFFYGSIEPLSELLYNVVVNQTNMVTRHHVYKGIIRYLRETMTAFQRHLMESTQIYLRQGILAMQRAEYGGHTLTAQHYRAWLEQAIARYRPYLGTKIPPLPDPYNPKKYIYLDLLSFNKK